MHWNVFLVVFGNFGPSSRMVDLDVDENKFWCF